MLIDKNDYFEFICTSTESLVHLDHLNQTTIPFTRLRESFRSPHVAFKKGKLSRIHDKSQVIEVEVEVKQSIDQKNMTNAKSSLLEMPLQQKKKQTERIEYDFLVIATGSGYPKPIKENFDSQVKYH